MQQVFDECHSCLFANSSWLYKMTQEVLSREEERMKGIINRICKVKICDKKFDIENILTFVMFISYFHLNKLNWK